MNSAVVDAPEQKTTTSGVIEIVTKDFTLATDARCDRCNAQAYVELKLATGKLLFCAHHYQAKKESLAPFVLEGRDESARLKA